MKIGVGNGLLEDMGLGNELLVDWRLVMVLLKFGGWEMVHLKISISFIEPKRGPVALSM